MVIYFQQCEKLVRVDSKHAAQISTQYHSTERVEMSG